MSASSISPISPDVQQFEELDGCELEEIEIITGRQLARLLRRLNASQRAILASDLRSGTLIVTDLTAQQAECLAAANHAYVTVAHHLPDDDVRREVRWGYYGLAQFIKPSVADRQADPTIASSVHVA
jgi:hypothetical protein